MKKILPTSVLVILGIIPILIWVFMEPLSLRFFDLNSTTTSLGQITGLVGMTLFALNLIISNRSVFFDKFFSGLHNLYFAHKWLGVISFCLLLFHPIFLVVKFISISLYEAAMFLLPVNNLAVSLGIFALLGMIVLLSLTLYFKMKYQIWKFSHKIMNFVFLIALFHVLFINSDVSENMLLRGYILFFSFLGLFSGFYRSFIRVLSNSDYKYRVKKINILSDSVREIEFEPMGETMSFYPGQFVFIKFIKMGMTKESHPFSISSGVGDKNFKVTIKNLGDFTGNLNLLNEGISAKVEGPYGRFFDNRKGNKEIWLAGGVGITPFLSMARSLNENAGDIYLFYCLNEEKEAVLLEELKSISSLNKKFHLITWYSNDRGRINVDAIKEISLGVELTDIYICGPSQFMLSLKDQFISHGVDKNNIHFEEFSFI